MLIAALDPELYLKSPRTQRRMVGVLMENIRAALGTEVHLTRLAGHRIAVEPAREETRQRLSGVFGVGAVEVAEVIEAADFEQLAADVARLAARSVVGKTFAVRPRRLGSHDWRSQDLAIAVGTLLVEAGGSVDLSNPQVTVVVRIVDDTAYLTTEAFSGAGGLPAGSQGRALTLFSGGMDSPVATYLVARRGVALDHLHFSLGCGQADHAAGIAHLLADRHGGSTDPILHVADLEPSIPELQRRVKPRDRQMALKALMYRVAERVAGELSGVRALVTGESLGQVSTQTLDNLAALDRLVAIPVLRPLVGMDKQQIRSHAESIGTYELTARTRELCDISGGARVTVSTSPGKLVGIGHAVDDLVDDVVMTTKATRLADWIPGTP